MAGEAVRPVSRYPDDYTIVNTVIPLIGSGSAISGRVFTLMALDSAFVLDAAWATVPGTTTANVATGTNVDLTLFVANATDKPAAGVTGTAVAVSSLLAIGGTGNDTAALVKPFAMVTTTNIIPSGSALCVVYNASASIGSANVVTEYITITMRIRTKRDFSGIPADAFKKTA